MIAGGRKLQAVPLLLGQRKVFSGIGVLIGDADTDARRSLQVSDVIVLSRRGQLDTEVAARILADGNIHLTAAVAAFAPDLILRRDLKGRGAGLYLFEQSLGLGGARLPCTDLLPLCDEPFHPRCLGDAHRGIAPLLFRQGFTGGSIRYRQEDRSGLFAQPDGRVAFCIGVRGDAKRHGLRQDHIFPFIPQGDVARKRRNGLQGDIALVQVDLAVLIGDLLIFPVVPYL